MRAYRAKILLSSLLSGCAFALHAAEGERMAQAADGSLTLPAATAQLIGTLRRQELERPTIGFWGQLSDFVRWQVRVARPGRFMVQLLYAIDRNGCRRSVCRVEVGDAQVEAGLPMTTSWYAFNRVQMGPVTIGAQATTVEVHGVEMDGVGLMNLQEVRLVPVP
jgi:hypothetical protein